MRKSGGIVIAIDGPAGAGKSTVARGVAARLGYIYLDTGAMYRAIALKAVREGIAEENADLVVEFLSRIRIDMEPAADGLRIMLDGEDVSAGIRSPEVTRAVTWVCQIPEVRSFLVRLQRRMGADGGVVAEGRDMGTVVFPDAEVKVFLDADIQTQAARRLGDLKNLGHSTSLEAVAEDIERRDKADTNRELSPLTAAADAVRIDSSRLTPEQVIDIIITGAEKAIGRKEI